MNCELYLSNFPKQWKKEQIESFIQQNFSEFGEFTTSVQYSLNDLTYFAFVNYTSILEASNAKTQMEKFQFQNSKKKLYINYAKNKSYQKIAKKSSLVVKSIKGEIDENTVKEKFSKFGEIEKITLNKKDIDFNGVKKNLGICFIHYSNPEEAREAFVGARRDEEIMAIVDEDMVAKEPNFIHFSKDKKHHGKKIPQSYLQR